jgi:hypothetical protein
MQWVYTATMKHGQHYEQDYEPRYELHYELHYMPSYADSRWSNDCYCATPPLELRTDNAGYILMESRPRVPGACSRES